MAQKESILSAAQKSIRKNSEIRHSVISVYYRLRQRGVPESIRSRKSLSELFLCHYDGSMVRDSNLHTIYILLQQSAVLVLMAAAACLVVTLNPWIAFRLILS